MCPRVLLLSTSYGSGTVSAAKAVESALRQLAPQMYIRSVDLLQLPGASLRQRLVSMSRISRDKRYNDASMRGNLPRKDWLLYLLERWVNLNSLAKRCLKPAVSELLSSEKWDVIVSTDSYSADFVASLQVVQQRRIPRLFVCTDYGMVGDNQINPPCDHYFTPSEEATVLLKSYGIPESRISTTGIPVRSIFTEHQSREACQQLLRLKGEKPVVLMIAGWACIEPSLDVFRNLLAIEVACEIVVITGKQESLKEVLQQIEVPKIHTVHLSGYSENMNELIRCSDVVVTKPGGSSTAELLVCGAATVIVNAYLDLELSNSDYLLENGAAVKVASPASLALKINRLLTDDEKLKSLRTNALKLARPQAAIEIAKTIKKIGASHLKASSQ